MKLIIEGKDISKTKADVFVNDRFFCTERVHHNTVEIVLNDSDALPVTCRFYDESCSKDSSSGLSDCDEEVEDDSEGVNEDLIAPDLQYSYTTAVEELCDKDIIKLVPKRMMEFNDFIVFTPDDNTTAVYHRKESDDVLRQKIRNNIKQNIIDFVIIYPIAIVIAVLCVFLPNIIDSYSLPRLLGPIFFFSILAPPIATIIFTKDYIKMKRFLLKTPQLPVDWEPAREEIKDDDA